jgi:hypothetical protein
MSNTDLFDLELNDPANVTLETSDHSDEEPVDIHEDLVQVNC